MINLNNIKRDIKKINNDFGVFRILMPEILSIVNNIKPAGRFNIPLKYLNAFTNLLKKNNLKFSVSEYRIIFSGKFENFDYTQDSGKNSDLYYIFVAKKKELVKKLEMYEKDKLRYLFEFSTLLGYPKCCVRNFQKGNIQTQNKKHPDSKKNSKGTKKNSWFLNSMFLNYDPFRNKDISNLPKHL
ncbi:MAG: hypothetical protein KKH98_01330, partial [Spirochaetes bacterium]|nr:hypothetical protein [Spirochaetota bacterium]